MDPDAPHPLTASDSFQAQDVRNNVADLARCQLDTRHFGMRDDDVSRQLLCRHSGARCNRSETGHIGKPWISRTTTDLMALRAQTPSKRVTMFSVCWLRLACRGTAQQVQQGSSGQFSTSCHLRNSLG